MFWAWVVRCSLNSDMVALKKVWEPLTYGLN